MIINGYSLLHYTPIVDMLDCKERAFGVSYGLAEAGYDIRIKQRLEFVPTAMQSMRFSIDGGDLQNGRFAIASTVDEFKMPPTLVGVVHDKSTWARCGISVFNTVIEPGWCGFLTLEIVYHGSEPLVIPAGAGIAQVLFSSVYNNANYSGKYQHQEDRPVDAIFKET